MKIIGGIWGGKNKFAEKIHFLGEKFAYVIFFL